MADQSRDKELEPISSTWPGGFGIYKYSKQAVMTNVSSLLLLAIIALIVGGSFSAIFRDTRADNLVSWIIGAFFSGSFTYMFLASVKGNKVKLEDALRKGWQYFFYMLLLNALVSLALLGSLLLFVIPFFFVLPRLVLAPYFLVDKNLDPVEAFKASWYTTKGHSAKVWGIFGVGLLMVLPVITIIGIPVTAYFLYMYSAATVVLYQWLQKHATTS